MKFGPGATVALGFVILFLFTMTGVRENASSSEAVFTGEISEAVALAQKQGMLTMASQLTSESLYPAGMRLQDREEARQKKCQALGDRALTVVFKDGWHDCFPRPERLKHVPSIKQSSTDDETAGIDWPFTFFF